LLLALAHALVDAYAAMVQPLWPDLQRGLALDDRAMQWAFVLWSLATSVSQLAFGYWGDRGRGRHWLWVGTALGVLGMSTLGLAGSFPALAALIVVGGLGVAAFHPEAAALAGSCAPADRSRAMSLFAVGGYIGQAAGPVYSGVVSTRFGLPALAWSAPWGLVLVVLLALGMRREAAGATAAGRHAPAPPSVSLAELLRGKGRVVGLMLAIGVLRVLPGIGVPLALAYLLKARGGTNAEIGLAQAVFLGGVGAGSLGCALWVRHASERRVLSLLPLLGVPFLLVCPAAGYAALTACVAAVGLVLGAVMPILIGYGQHVLREGQRVASSLTMGVTWGLGGMLIAALMAGLNHAGRPDLAFPVFAAATALSCALCSWLPHQSAAHAPDFTVATIAPATPAGR
jgi:FSR family fosmidomycin resistance protein-like MFS transporter